MTGVLLPTLQAAHLREGLTDYLATTFALTEPDARASLIDFVGHPESGMFKGPYVRLRLSFAPAAGNWKLHLDWYEGFPPYGHQASAFERLSSKFQDRPQPTLVTTGTGSGKTEAFLIPIIDHVLRMRWRGVAGMKALILYPMNALANDQAGRLAAMLTTHPALAGITAGLLTGEQTGGRTTVTEGGLITDRKIMQETAPDILLTNYKMLDWLLLRSEFAPMWRGSADSLQYVVLDEFHTYDGAQGTDVAMLLRRLGLTLKSHWTDDSPVSAQDRARPLGRINPVATSATLGEKADSASMLTFAHTVFGEEFPASAVIGETRLTADEWLADRRTDLDTRYLAKEPAVAEAVGRIKVAVAEASDAGRDITPVVVRAVLAELYEVRDATAATPMLVDPLADATLPRRLSGTDPDLKEMSRPENILDLLKGHPIIARLLAATGDAVSRADVAAAVLPSAIAPDPAVSDHRGEFLDFLLAMMSKVRESVGRAAPGLEVHLWIRELTRIDRLVRATPGYRWADDGVTEDYTELYLPAIYCRHCGRSGWGARLAPTGNSLDVDDQNIRADHFTGSNQRFRALISAPGEATQAERVEGLHWFSTEHREIRDTAPDPESSEAADGRVLPMLMLTGPDAGELSGKDQCPACGMTDGIRFLGSAVATQLSVTLSNLFGAKDLDAAEKKALMFTDSVQDAAHRAGFVQARSHSLSLRSALRNALSNGGLDLTDLSRQVIADARRDPQRRYQLLAPDIVDRDEFTAFWDRKAATPARQSAEVKAKRRLQFDIDLEFGLQSRVGRTLELTGSVTAEVYLGAPGRAVILGRQALSADANSQRMLTTEGLNNPVALARWVRGTVERVRTQGGILHEWLHRYIDKDANRWAVWGGRLRGQGMPAFPKGRSAPAFPALTAGKVAEGFDAITSPNAWYARWASRCLGISPQDGTFLAKALFGVLAEQRLVETRVSESGTVVYGIQPSTVRVNAPSPEALQDRQHLLVCTVCHTPVPGTETVIGELDGAPCLLVRCPGLLERTKQEANFYRTLYDSAEMKRVVAREHTSLLSSDDRLKYEIAFKGSADDPQAPNVLVATPTLEMGIDIGDLSTVMLGSLPRSVSSYLQRVGRAGRLTGNSLVLAFVRGRGEHLPKLFEPLSVIQGQVRPPATFLNAEEILQRQYVAHIADRLARDPQRTSPMYASAVLGSLDECSWLGRFIEYADGNAAAFLAEFLGQFGGLLSDETVAALTDWVRPAEAGSLSAMAVHLQQTAQRWSHDLAVLTTRRLVVSESIPELKIKAESSAATEEDARALRTARGSLKLLGGQINSITKEHWIAVLEKYGVLPNYTLLDDTVTLDVGVTWIDPDTSEFQGQEIEYRRGSRVALTELAPGATFYAQGLAVKIDAIDIDQGESNIQTWQICPQCGWLGIYAAGVQDAPVVSCPRCHTHSIADVKQSFKVIEMSKVSAEVRRDEASINDAWDERVRERFTVLAAADINPANVAGAWFVQNQNFGAEYLKQLDIRWLNVGRTTSQGQKRLIAGIESTTSLFRICAHCGQLDKAAGRNNRDEHRSWCVHRKAATEDVREIALARTLHTQGVLLHLPPQLEYDPFAYPSLSAAVLLGLREVIGGSPEHLDVATVRDALQAPDRRALLIHDTVPGGTGYLAEFAHANRVWSVLARAWSILRSCPCREEERLACHRCLLPFATPMELDKVSRTSALKALSDILGVGEHHQPEFDDWEITDVAPPPLPPGDESFLEKDFYATLIERLRFNGASVTEKPGVYSPKATITVPGAPSRRWTLKPQVTLGFVTPDFVLSTQDPSIPQVAIFTDGRKFHATSENNRVSDDAAKREALREQGYLVWAITHQDLQEFKTNAPTGPAWFNEGAAAVVREKFNVQPGTMKLLALDPVSQLLEFIFTPAIDSWRLLSRWMPYLFVTPTNRTKSSAAGIAQSALATMNDKPAFSVAGTDICWSFGTANIVVTAAVTSIHDKAATAVLAIDDRGAALESLGGSGWREWLRLSNWLGISGEHRITTRTQLDSNTIATPASARVQLTLDPRWQALLDDTVTEAEREIVKLLAVQGELPLPELGHEADDGSVLDLAWPALKIAVVFDRDLVDAALLAAGGWELCRPDASAVVERLLAAGRI